MNVKISTVLHGIFEISINQDDDITMVKKKIEEKKGYPTRLQKLVLNGVFLKDQIIIKDTKVKEDSIIICILPVNYK
jgi:hypothetical protein